MKLNGSQILCEAMVREGVSVVFGQPGGAIMPFYNFLRDYNLRHILCRHEQGAAHMADGYARATGEVGVAMATSGPGATNMVTGIVTALMDSVPIVCLTGQVPTNMMGGDAFQETDTTGITMPVTKHNYQLMDVRDIARVVKEAFHVARTGRPGPVLIDFPKDIQTAEGEYEEPDGIDLPGFKPTLRGNVRQVRQAAKLIGQAKKPIILAGHGIILAEAYDELLAFAEKTEIPVITTLLGISGFPDTHRLHFGFPGMHGTYYANMAISDCDLMVAVGMRMDDRVTGRLNAFAPYAKVIHIDIDPAELGKNVHATVPIVGDAKEVLGQLLGEVEPNEHPDWLQTLNEWRIAHPSLALPEFTEKMSTPWILRQLYHATDGQAILVTDVGQSQMWAAQHYFFDRRNTHITSGGLGPMGYALPAAIGVQAGRPNEEVWCVTGDGGYQMTMQEMAVIAEERLPIRIALINNGYLGMVRQWQELFWEKRYMAVEMQNPDFVKLSEAYGIPARRVETTDEVMPTYEWARRIDGPALIDFRVEREENVWPMVPPGASLQETLEDPAQSSDEAITADSMREMVASGTGGGGV